MIFLIVNDNPAFRTLIRNEISNGKDTVFELDDALNVTDKFQEVRPDWVIIDLQMKNYQSRENGFSSTQKLKSVYPEAKVIIIANFIDKYYQNKSLKVGADAFVSKENLFELHKIINNNITA